MEPFDQKRFFDLLRERSRQIAPEYPNIQNDLDPFEHLWAITSSYEGTSKANDDCHEFIRFLIRCLRWTTEEAIKGFELHKKGAKQP